MLEQDSHGVLLITWLGKKKPKQLTVLHLPSLVSIIYYIMLFIIWSFIDVRSTKIDE